MRGENYPQPDAQVSDAPGETARMTTKAVIIKAAAKKAIKATLPRLAGNLPLMIQYCPSKYRWNPMKSIRMAIPMNVAPRGLPILRSRLGSDR